MHPILFHLGSFPVHSYGVMTALAFVFGLWTATLRAKRVKISGEIIADVTLWVMVGTIIGARTVYVVTYWKDEFAGQPLAEIFAIWHGGLVYYGGLIGASLAGIIYLRWKKAPLWKIADVMAPSIALGSVFGRIGCFLNGCCYGRACEAPWAVSFPADNPLHPPTTPVHPTEIYDALLNLGLYVFLAWLFRRKKFDGQIFATYLICYAITRSFVEYFRGDYNDAHHHFGLTPAQLVSVPIFVTGLALAAILSRQQFAEMKPPIFIAGPTAVGKSEIALLLAEKIGGEIISADSMQVYRGLDIGTAKPTPAERARVPHHLVDICDLTEAFDAAQFIRHAQQAVMEIHARGRVPIFCGGTGLYFKAFLSGLGEAPATNPELRAELEAASFEALLHELRERDPVAYEKIDKQNPRRVIRAVEVIRLTGKKFSEQRAEWKSEAQNPKPKASFCFTRSGPDLHARINARVDAMFARGLVEETRALLAHGLAENKTAMQAIGYRQVVEYLRDERSLTETIELVKSRTRQFAKRQLTWFRRHGNMEWIELKPEKSLAAVADDLLRAIAGN